MQEEEDSHGKPLAPVQDYPRSDVESGDMIFNNPKSLRPQEKSSKCLVYILSIMVILGILLLLFGTVFLRARTPDFEFESVRVRNLNYLTDNNSSSPSFNFTLVTEIAVDNTNFGDFRFGNTTGTVSWGLVVVGEVKVPTGSAEARAKERLNVSIDVSSLRVPNTTSLSSNVSSGFLDLRSYVKLSGRVNIMNIMKRRRHPELNCFIKVNLRASSVQDFTCD